MDGTGQRVDLWLMTLTMTFQGHGKKMKPKRIWCCGPRRDILLSRKHGFRWHRSKERFSPHDFDHDPPRPWANMAQKSWPGDKEVAFCAHLNMNPAITDQNENFTHNLDPDMWPGNQERPSWIHLNMDLPRAILLSGSHHSCQIPASHLAFRHEQCSSQSIN